MVFRWTEDPLPTKELAPEDLAIKEKPRQCNSELIGQPVVSMFLSAGPIAPLLRKVSPVKEQKWHWPQLHWWTLKPTMKLKQRKLSPEDTSPAKQPP